MKLSILIPAYNEEKRLPETLKAVKKYFHNFEGGGEIIVIDDGSSDKTVEISKRFAVKTISYAKNMGKGFAIKEGVEAAAGEYILFLDADNATPVEEFTKLLSAIEHADIAIGSRYLPESRVEKKQSIFRIAIGRIGNLIIQFLILKNIKDTQCGFKLFRNVCAKTLFSELQTLRFGFDIEILARAVKKNYKIIEVPVTWLHNEVSRVRPIRDSMRTFFDLLRIAGKCRL